MILEFSVENFLSIKNKQTLSFESASKDNIPDRHYVEMEDGKKILRLACIYGANASGKTNLLLAYGFFLDYILNGFNDLSPTDPIDIVPFAFTQEKNEVSIFELQFYHENHRYIYRLSVNKTQVLQESLQWYQTTQKKLIYSRDETGDVKWGTGIKGAKKQIASMTTKNVTFLNVAAKLGHPVISPIYQDMVSTLLPVVSPETGGLLNNSLRLIEENATYKKDYIKLLSAAYFNNIKDIRVETKDIPQEFLKGLNPETVEHLKTSGYDFKERQGIVVHEFDKKEYLLPLSQESSGTRRFLELAYPLLISILNSGVLLIDEIECSLHKDLLEFFLDTFLDNGKESQLIFTTHITDLMDSELLRDDEVWFAKKQADGSSLYDSISDYEGVRKGASRKKLYEADRFGAKPIISHVLFEKEDLIGTQK
ncbi:putative ATPase [Sphaerochaeta pleomorpha str. Grapes]|uniref:Putative ATPase n=1 Tax=Sphaerochaeta pleomorpha (strain ATCC BAA-1885 / DSM 22778 / Grapes) TaxID=158190 RepID=G8QWC3_SPHPG|nr:ATP-binding protein [Sphaerochaeta pleomorpha]AEV29421.1 putative ATPase [Sphaerochaeta pleomorpha str. Grapes]